jgi:hypothetical protein
MNNKRHYAVVGIFTVMMLIIVFQYSSMSAGNPRPLLLRNGNISCTITVDSLQIVSEKLEGDPVWLKGNGSQNIALTTDGDFCIEVMWTDWQAPGKVNNADNLLLLTKKDFHFVGSTKDDFKTGRQRLTLEFAGNDFVLGLRVIYELDQNTFYIRRQLEIFDTSAAGHFLQQVWPVNAVTPAIGRTIKEGGFGQPVAFSSGEGGFFYGLEYPTSVNTLKKETAGMRIVCGTEVGKKIGASPFRTEYVVEGICPTPSVKLWFMRYVNDIRVAPLKPYTLYNSWYDLRSPEYPRVQPENVMNEKNILRIIGLMRKNMIEKHNIKLDAFVLDDGWDVYQSDWVLRSAEFPNGLKPIADTLKKTNTTLGLWFGPTGGYSFRMKRVGWMQEHGYEVVGHTVNTAMMCLAGQHYSDLFKKRTTDFVANAGVGYFKWDGIQWSCSEPDHGHPVGVSSRRAVMESVIDKCTAVRAINRNVFLNISSGTWLSPWWVKYANQIWMQGADYGYADVPSLSPRDAAITYRDFALHEDFRENDLWFPIQNLMTHGIIKGNLQKLGGESEPLDKFTNEALLYFARGVSMWELYISPDILTEGEWDAMGEAMQWAKDRFPVLSTTEMIGGDPKKRETYGYVHFRGNRGIIAARNPWIAPGTLKADLSPALGLDPDASSLVLERVYPTRWISPQLYRAGSVVELPLAGYETAVYELYPVADAKRPLIAGVRFDASARDSRSYAMTVYGGDESPVLLNKEWVSSMKLSGADATIGDLSKTVKSLGTGGGSSVSEFTPQSAGATMTVDIPAGVRNAKLELLLTSEEGTGKQKPPSVKVTVDGLVFATEYMPGESSSRWYTSSMSPGEKHKIAVSIASGDSLVAWKGHASFWLGSEVKDAGAEVLINSPDGCTEAPMPPRPFPAGVRQQNLHLGEITIFPDGR